MANSIQQAVDSASKSTGGRQALHGSGQLGLKAATYKDSNTSNGFGAAMANFAKTGVAAYGQYKESRDSQADARSNEILRKLTPEQRRDAFNNGTLLYQDYPEVMAALKTKTGRLAAYQVDSDLQADVKMGKYKTRQELEEARQIKLEEAAKSNAEAAGIDYQSPEYQAGFNSDYVQRSAGIYDTHGQFLSQNFQAQAVMNGRQEMGAILNDPAMMADPKAADDVIMYINNGLQNSLFGSDALGIEALQGALKDATSKENGQLLLENIGDKTINVLGGERTVKDLLGPEAYENLVVSAQENAFNRDRDRNASFALNVNNALKQEDPSTGWRLLNEMEANLDAMQPGPLMTAQKAKIIAAKVALQDSIKQQTAAKRASMDKLAQSDNRQLAIGDAYEKRIGQENVSVDKKGMSVTNDTGEFKESDWATFANTKLEEINNLKISDSAKDEMRAAYLRADFEGGPFQQKMGTLITDVERSLSYATVSGELKDTKRLEELQKMYSVDPATISMMFPDQAGLLEELRIGAELGLEPQVMVDARIANKGLSKEVSFEREQAWAGVKNNSAEEGLKYLPVTFEKSARSVFDAISARTGDPKMAEKAVTEWLKKTAVNITDSSGYYSATGFHGMISKKNMLADPNDINSWVQGQQIVGELIENTASNPDFAGGHNTVEFIQGAIIIQSPNGSRVRMPQTTIQNIYQDRRAVMEEQRKEKAVKGALKEQALRERWLKGGALR